MKYDLKYLEGNIVIYVNVHTYVVVRPNCKNMNDMQNMKLVVFFATVALGKYKFVAKKIWIYNSLLIRLIHCFDNQQHCSWVEL